MPRLRAAIVGAGLMGHWHARYAARSGVKIAAVVDRNPDAARALGRTYPRAVHCTSLEECLEQVAVDSVHICTPAGSHFPLARAALRAGRHVLVEKPATQTANEAAELVELARESSLQLACVHQFPFQRGFRLLRRDLQGIGPLVRIEYRVHSAGGDHLDPQGRRRVLLELLPHAASLLRPITGVRAADCDWTLLRSSVDDLDLSGDCEGVALDLRLSLTARPTLNRLSVTGQCGAIHADLFHDYAWREHGRVSRADKLLLPFRQSRDQFFAAGANLARRMLYREPAYPGLLQLICEFYRSVRSGTPISAEPEEIPESAHFVERVDRLATAANSLRARNVSGPRQLCDRELTLLLPVQDGRAYCERHDPGECQQPDPPRVVHHLCPDDIGNVV